jgi:hypothetical protein
MYRSGPEYQTEVVLLSRSILLQGSPESASELAGGHVRIESKVRRQRCGRVAVAVAWYP